MILTKKSLFPIRAIVDPDHEIVDPDQEIVHPDQEIVDRRVVEMDPKSHLTLENNALGLPINDLALRLPAEPSRRPAFHGQRWGDSKCGLPDSRGNTS